jgi:hypothetical protein
MPSEYTFGREIRHLINGVKVIPPEMRPDEQVIWSARANHVQNKLRTVGGKLYMTEARLVFGRHKLDAAMGGQEWECPLDQILSTESKGITGSVHVHLRDGSTEKFIVRPAGKAAAAIQEAAEIAAAPAEAAPEGAGA